MRGYALQRNDPGSQIVRAMRDMSFSGNVYHVTWLHYIRHIHQETAEAGKPNANAVLILAEIAYWYRPIQERDENTGALLPLRKRFKGRYLRKSREELADLFGLSVRQVRCALDSLEAAGVITRHIVKKERLLDGSYAYNILELELHPARLQEISTPLETSEDLQVFREGTEDLQVLPSDLQVLRTNTITVDGGLASPTYTENKETTTESVCNTLLFKQGVPPKISDTHTFVQPAPTPAPIFGQSLKSSIPPKPQPLNFGNPNTQLESPRSTTPQEDAFAERLQVLCGVGAMATIRKQREVEEAAQVLVRGGATLKQVDVFQEWWGSCFYGKKGDLPAVVQVRDLWERAMQWKAGQSNRATASTSPDLRYNPARGIWEVWTGNSWGDYGGVVPTERLQEAGL